MTALQALLGLHAVWQLEAVLAVVLRVSLLAVLGVAAIRVAGRRADVRDTIWKVALVALLLLPALSFSLPAIAIELELPAWLARLDNPVRLSGARAAAASLLGAAPSPSVAPARGPGVYAWIALAWALGAGLLLARLLVGAVRLRRVCERAKAVDDACASTLHELKRELGIGREVRLLSSDHFAVPLTFGVRRPVVVVPTASAAWSAARLRAVLLHELEHVRRRDWVWQLCARVLCAAYWFHPAAWWLASRQRLDAELICDGAAVSHGLVARDYAVHLCAIATGGHRPAAPLGTAPAFVRRSELEHRVHALLLGEQTRSRRGRAWLVACAFMACLLPALALTPYAAGCERTTATSVDASGPPTPAAALRR